MSGIPRTRLRMKQSKPLPPGVLPNGHMIKLPTIGGGYGYANWINQQGDITGGYLAPPHQKRFHGLLWRDGKMTDLPPVGGAAWAFGNAVNEQDQVVGREAPVVTGTFSSRSVIGCACSA